MFERFTDRARTAVVLAQEEARQLQHSHIGTEHLLLGMLRGTDNVASTVLRRLGIELTDVRSDILAIVPRGTTAPPGHIPFTARAKKVLELSLREALSLGHKHIGTEHILLGLVREGDGLAAQVLVARGAELTRVRTAVLEALQKSNDEKAPAPAARTRGTEEALAIAEELAATAPTGTHHLLEALARSTDSVAGRVLSKLGVSADSIAAAADEIGLDGTTDSTPEQSAARQMEVRVDGDEVHVVLRDGLSLATARALSEHLGGPLRGDQTAGAPVGLWQAVNDALADLERRLRPSDADAAVGSAPTRVAAVRQSIQSRLARRRRPD